MQLRTAVITKRSRRLSKGVIILHLNVRPYSDEASGDVIDLVRWEVLRHFSNSVIFHLLKPLRTKEASGWTPSKTWNLQS